MRRRARNHPAFAQAARLAALWPSPARRSWTYAERMACWVRPSARRGTTLSMRALDIRPRIIPPRPPNGARPCPPPCLRDGATASAIPSPAAPMSASPTGVRRKLPSAPPTPARGMIALLAGISIPSPSRSAKVTPSLRHVGGC
jgi:hypothetical protein